MQVETYSALDTAPQQSGSETCQDKSLHGCTNLGRAGLPPEQLIPLSSACFCYSATRAFLDVLESHCSAPRCLVVSAFAQPGVDSSPLLTAPRLRQYSHCRGSKTDTQTAFQTARLSLSPSPLRSSWRQPQKRANQTPPFRTLPQIALVDHHRDCAFEIAGQRCKLSLPQSEKWGRAATRMAIVRSGRKKFPIRTATSGAEGCGSSAASLGSFLSGTRCPIDGHEHVRSFLQLFEAAATLHLQSSVRGGRLQTTF